MPQWPPNTTTLHMRIVRCGRIRGHAHTYRMHPQPARCSCACVLFHRAQTNRMPTPTACTLNRCNSARARSFFHTAAPPHIHTCLPLQRHAGESSGPLYRTSGPQQRDEEAAASTCATSTHAAAAAGMAPPSTSRAGPPSMSNAALASVHAVPTSAKARGGGGGSMAASNMSAQRLSTHAAAAMSNTSTQYLSTHAVAATHAQPSSSGRGAHVLSLPVALDPGPPQVRWHASACKCGPMHVWTQARHRLARQRACMFACACVCVVVCASACVCVCICV